MRIFGLISLLFLTSGCSLFAVNGEELEGDSAVLVDIGFSEYSNSAGNLTSIGLTTYPLVGEGVGLHFSMDDGIAKDISDYDYTGYGLGVSYSVNEAVGVYAGGSWGTLESLGVEFSESGLVLGVHAFVRDYQPLGADAFVVGLRSNTAIDSTIFNVGLVFEE